MFLLVAALLAASFVTGRFFQPPPAPDAAVQANTPIAVWAPVERRVVQTGSTFAGTVTAGVTRDISITAEGPAVVLHRDVEPGQRVRPGDAAGEVSGTAYLFLPEPLALYRDLTEGDRGKDVESLQNALKRTGRWTPTDGVFGKATARAVREAFRQAGSPLPAEEPVTVGWRQFIPVPPEGAIVTDAADYGTTLGDDVPLLTLQITPPNVQFTADGTQAAALDPGQRVEMASGRVTFEGSIEQIGPFQRGSDGTMPGHTVTVTTAHGSELPPVGQSVSITTSPDTGSTALAVPQTAVRTEGSSSYVIVQRGSEDHHVPVTVDGTGGGWAAVSGDVSEGDRVKVS